ncbi:hypothetical protein AB0H00_00055 [Nocardia sp. NPDC023852]|uniref:hypothetical protein n=1 Tax=Nocardia sp. NPDC023852 TaxID=3154697 RepID=UPI0033D19A8F
MLPQRQARVRSGSASAAGGVGERDSDCPAVPRARPALDGAFGLEPVDPVVIALEVTMATSSSAPAVCPSAPPEHRGAWAARRIPSELAKPGDLFG